MDALAVMMFYLLKFSDDLDPEQTTFKDFQSINPGLAFVANQTTRDLPFVQKIITNLKRIAEADLDTSVEVYNNFSNSKEFNDWVYMIQADNFTGMKQTILMGVEFPDDFGEDNLNMILLYNQSSTSIYEDDYFVQLQRGIWSASGHGDWMSRSITLVQDIEQQFIGPMIPFFINMAISISLSFITSQLVIDLKQKKREYMQTCNLKLSTYWIAEFIVDYAILLVLVLVSFIIFIAIGIDTFKDNAGICIYNFLVNGATLLFWIYDWSFVFKTPDSASSFTTLFNILPMMIAMIVDMIVEDKGKVVRAWVYALLPITNSYGIFQKLSTFENKPFKEIITDSSIYPLLIFSILNFAIYLGLLFLIEYLRRLIPMKKAQSSFESQRSFFQQKKRLQNVASEAVEMEQEVQNSKDYAVRVYHASRLFYNEKKEPIAAVNDVSLGIKSGSLFGFLGANGAGKTTLMTMMTGNLPISDGTIEIDGKLVSGNNIPNISICPQFNDHLTDELTAEEQLFFFAGLFGIGQEEAEQKVNEFIDLLGLSDHRYKRIKELSGGNARKVAVAIAMMSDSNIVLLDEPTSSLDPVARHDVHNLIENYRGRKTFMLCTHLLEEAESLCDTISIMLKGCVYVVGTPQHLTTKFGTEWKADILIDTDNASSVSRVNEFMIEKLPQAVLTMSRPTNKTYSIPSDSMSLATLFNTLKEGMEANIGMKYFTCSSSSLEKVFLELVRKSEENEFVNEEDDEHLAEKP